MSYTTQNGSFWGLESDSIFKYGPEVIFFEQSYLKREHECFLNLIDLKIEDTLKISNFRNLNKIVLFLKFYSQNLANFLFLENILLFHC